MNEISNSLLPVNRFCWLREMLAADLRASCKIVAAYLFVSFRAETAECFPSTRAIAGGCGITIRAAQLAIADLRRVGAITVSRRGGLTIFSPAQPPSPPARTIAHGVARGGARGCAGRRTGLRPKEYPNEHPKEHRGGHVEERKGLRPEKERTDGRWRYEGARIRRG